MTSVTLCIPAHEAAEFVRPAIESALAQTHADVRVVVGVDRSEDDTVAVCREYEADERLRVVAHATRRGWAGNVNSLLDDLRTDLFAFVFHDDRVEPTFAAVLVDALARAPDAVVASGAIQLSGDSTAVRRLVDVRGNVAARLAAGLTQPRSHFSLKSMTRTSVLRQPGMRLHEADGGFRADTPFALRQLLHGEAVTVPDVLYHKTIRTGSVTSGWRATSPREYLERRARTRAEIHRVVADSGLSATDQRMLHAMVLAETPPAGLRADPDADARSVDELAVAAATVTRLLDPTGDEGTATPGLAGMLADHVARQRHRAAERLQDRGAVGPAAAQHVLAGGVRDVLDADGHVRAARALLRARTSDDLAVLALSHARTALAGARAGTGRAANAALAAAHALVVLRRWAEASTMLERAVAYGADPDGPVAALRRRLPPGSQA